MFFVKTLLKNKKYNCQAHPCRPLLDPRPKLDKIKNYGRSDRLATPVKRPKNRTKTEHITTYLFIFINYNTMSTPVGSSIFIFCQHF